jgi:hypothetical protein
MLRCVFVGSLNIFTEMMVHWLSKHSLLTGVVWTTSADWSESFSGRIEFAKKRLKRSGFLKTVDEMLYYALYKKVLKDARESIRTRLTDSYVGQYGSPEWRGNSITTDDVNSRAVLQFVRDCSADLMMSVCINELFRREIRESTRLGAFLWHEGIVPEYRGLYSPFWAIHNGEPEMLGYTVLRMNGQYDAGEVYLQGRVSDVDPKTDSACYIGHKAILDSLPGVARMLVELENGTAKPLPLEGRKSGCYTYPGFTDWIRQRRRLRFLRPVELEQSEARSPVAS